MLNPVHVLPPRDLSTVFSVKRFDARNWRRCLIELGHSYEAGIRRSISLRILRGGAPQDPQRIRRMAERRGILGVLMPLQFIASTCVRRTREEQPDRCPCACHSDSVEALRLLVSSLPFQLFPVRFV